MIALQALLHTDEASDRRDVDRRVIVDESTLRAADAHPHSIVVRDLSLDGCQVDTTTRLLQGDVVSVGLPGVGGRPATVLWVDGGRAGCQFHHPLSAKQFVDAFSGSTVVEGGFQHLAPADDREPHVEKWHPAIRLTFLVGLSCALWSAILHIV